MREGLVAVPADVVVTWFRSVSALSDLIDVSAATLTLMWVFIWWRHGATREGLAVPTGADLRTAAAHRNPVSGPC